MKYQGIISICVNFEADSVEDALETLDAFPFTSEYFDPYISSENHKVTPMAEKLERSGK